MAEIDNGLQNKESPSASGGGLLMGALGLGTGLLNSIGSYLGMKAQAKEQRELLDYQWRNMTSPHAQVSNWAAEGFNPAAMFGNQSQPANVGSVPSITAPQFGVGTMDMSSLASYISAIADAKKKGVEMPNIREDTNSKIIENDRKQYELELLRKYGDKKEYQELALAEQKVKLAMQQNDLNEQQKAINEYVKAKEAALQVTSEHQRDILKKELDNKDVELKLRNEESKQRAAASKASATASYASAEASKAQAENFRADTETKEVFNKFYKDRRYQHSFMSQVVEQGREAVSKRLITDRQAEQMEYLVEQAAYANDMKEFTYWSGQVNQFVNTLGSAASQFYGAGALRELIQLRKGQSAPHLMNGNDYYMQDGLLFKR